MASKEVRVGTGVIVVRDGKVLVGKRKGSHAAGLYSFPGGHLDFGETWVDCVLRELREECGELMTVAVRNFDPQRREFFVTNDIMPDYGKHYITIFIVADWLNGEPLNMEPDKCEGWEWVTLDELVTLIDDESCADWIPAEKLLFYRKQIGI
jgi:8-oxo-dGTP diphosphatase